MRGIRPNDEVRMGFSGRTGAAHPVPQMTSIWWDVIQMSACLNRCLSTSLNRLKKARCSGRSGTSTKKRVRLSRYVVPSCSQTPRTVWVSQEAAPKCSRNSRNVVTNSYSGTGVPSLYSNGTRISKRRKLLIGRGTEHGETNALLGKKAQRLGRHGHFAGSPAFAGKPGNEPGQRASLGLSVGKPDQDLHGDSVGVLPDVGKRPAERFAEAPEP